MISRLPPVASRLAALTLLLLLAATLWTLVWTPLQDLWTHGQEEAAQLHRLLAAHQAVAARRPVLEQRLKELQQDRTWEAALVPAPTPAVAAARLQATLKSLVEGQKGDIRTLQQVNSEAIAGLDKVTVRVEASLPVRNLVPFLQHLDRAMPRIFVESLTISGQGDFEQDEAGGREPRIALRADVYGFRVEGET